MYGLLFSKLYDDHRKKISLDLFSERTELVDIFRDQIFLA